MSTHHDAMDDRARRLDLSAWRELFGHVLAHRRSVLGLLVAAVATAGVDTCFPLVTRHVVDEVVARGRDADLLGPALAYLALMATLSACIAVFIVLAGRLSTHVAHDIREKAFARLQQMSFSFYDGQPTGWLVARMTSDCDRLARILAWGLLDAAWGLTIVLAVAVMLLVLSWKLALVVLAVMPALALVSLHFQRRILGTARRVRKANSRLTAAYNEDLMAVRTTKALAREEDSQLEFEALSGEMYEASVRNALQSALYLPIVLSLGSVSTALALTLGTGAVAAGALSVGTLVAFVHYTLRLFEPVQEVAATLAQVQMAQAAAERVLGILHAVPEIRDSAEVAAAIEARAAGPRPEGVAPDGGLPRVSRIELRDVELAYGKGEGPLVLRGVSLDVRAGQTVAFVGPTGGGKTSLAGVLCRFYEPTKGQVLLDGVDYRQRSLAWWRDQVAVVLQQPFLFRGTIRENVRYGRSGATDAEVEEAARLARAHDFVERLPGGYDTQVGERGSLLSTGQAQLVSIARALLADRPILVLDEATSSVDPEAERLLQDGLARVMRGRTCFVIAHRLSTIRAADLIAVVEGGLIVERGSHAELLAAGGQYRDLVLEQRLRQSARAPSAWSAPPA